MSEVTVPQFEFITVADWAANLRVSKRQIFRWIAERVIPDYDFSCGKTRRWHRTTYQNWVETQKGGK